jgi:hypothetical protein
MHPAKKAQLREKGWSTTEVDHAAAILEKAAQHDLHFSKMVFWSALVVIIFANLLISLILIPFLIVLNTYILFALLVLLGGTIGFLYNFLITDIGLLEKKQHRRASVIIPLIALGNMLVMVWVSNRFITDLQVQNTPHNIWVVSGVFVVAFILPYVIDQIMKKVKS